MKYRLLFSLILFTSLNIGLISCSSEENPTPLGMMQVNMDDDNDNDDGDPTNANEEAPDFKLMSVDGGDVELDNFSGKPLVIFFFGSTCPLCISSAPSVESGINDKFSADQMSIIGIDTWDGNKEAVQNFRNTTHVSFDLLLNGSQVESDYDITYDRLLVVDAEGNIVFKGNSSASNNVDDVVQVIESLLK